MSTIFLCSEPFANHMIVFYFFGSICEQNTQLAIPVNNELKQQGDGAGETSRTTNYELQGTGWATRAPVAQTLQSVRQTCPRTTAT